MKKPSPASTAQIEAAYHHLISKKAISIDEWIFYSKLCRFDPRIAEAWLKRMMMEWKKIPPVLLQEKNLATPAPATIGVLLEQLEDYLLEKKSKKQFKLWKETALMDTPPSHGESFLIGVYPFASIQMMKNAEFPLRSFSTWGFSGSEIFVNKAISSTRIKNKTGLSPETRLRKLNDFILQLKRNKQSRFTVEDYLLFSNHTISRRVVQMDLKQCKRIQAQGETQARTYLILR